MDDGSWERCTIPASPRSYIGKNWSRLKWLLEISPVIAPAIPVGTCLDLVAQNSPGSCHPTGIGWNLCRRRRNFWAGRTEIPAANPQIMFG
jgi:hypothetical protein